MNPIVIDPELILISLDVNNQEEGISALARLLNKKELVKPGFEQHVVEREKVYPTGLPTLIPVAICHTDAEFVNQSALAIATLKKPVVFSEMGNPDGKLNVEVIFVLALNDPKEQVVWLQKLVVLFQNEGSLAAIRNAVSAEMLVDYLKTNL